MLLQCSECYEPLHSPYFAVISTYKQNAIIEEGPGLGICSSHVEDRLGELRKRYRQHKLYKLSDGLIFLLDEIESASNPDGTLDASTETRRQGIIGYLVNEEMKRYLPRTLDCLSSRLRELGVIVIS